MGASFLDVDRGVLHYEAAGEGHPLVLLHAGIANMRMWDDQFEVFSQRYKVIRYDLRGFGGSTSEPGAYSYRQDLYDLLSELGVESAYVMGVSIGGSIAVDFTLDHPEMVDALIPVAAGLSGFRPEVPDEVKQSYEAMKTAWKSGDRERLLELEMDHWFEGPGQPRGRANPDVRRRMTEMERANLETEVEGLEGVPLEPPATGRLHEIHVPTLVIVGDLDSPDVLAASDRLAGEIPSARELVIHGAAHIPNMEQPEEFNRAVLDFLTEVDRQYDEEAE